MEIRNIQYRLRRRRLDEVFDFAVLVLRTHFLRFVAYSLPGALLLAGLNIWLLFALDLHEGDAIGWPALGIVCLLIVEQSLFAFPLVLLNGNLVFDSAPSLSQVFSGWSRLLLRYLGRVVLVRTSLMTYLAPMLVTAYRGFVHHFFLPEVLLLERLSGRDVNRRLGALARGRADRTVVFILLDLVLGAVFVICATYSYNLLTSAVGLDDLHPLFQARVSLLSPMMHVFIFIYFAFHSTAKFLFYLDIRSLLEGWDIELMLLKGVQDTDGQGTAA